MAKTIGDLMTDVRRRVHDGDKAIYSDTELASIYYNHALQKVMEQLKDLESLLIVQEEDIALVDGTRLYTPAVGATGWDGLVRDFSFIIYIVDGTDYLSEIPMGHATKNDAGLFIDEAEPYLIYDNGDGKVGCLPTPSASSTWKLKLRTWIPITEYEPTSWADEAVIRATALPFGARWYSTLTYLTELQFLQEQERATAQAGAALDVAWQQSIKSTIDYGLIQRHHDSGLFDIEGT